MASKIGTSIDLNQSAKCPRFVGEAGPRTVEGSAPTTPTEQWTPAVLAPVRSIDDIPGVSIHRTRGAPPAPQTALELHVKDVVRLVVDAQAGQLCDANRRERSLEDGVWGTYSFTYTRWFHPCNRPCAEDVTVLELDPEWRDYADYVVLMTAQTTSLVHALADMIVTAVSLSSPS